MAAEPHRREPDAARMAERDIHKSRELTFESRGVERAQCHVSRASLRTT